jgi:hypothetical protein
MQSLLWTLASLAAFVALCAGLADRRRALRADLDRVGWVPWPLVLILAIILAALFAALALKG